MKQIGYVHLEMEKDEHLYTFSMPIGAPLAEAADVSFMVFKAIDKMYRDVVDKEIEKKEQEGVELKGDDVVEDQ